MANEKTDAALEKVVLEYPLSSTSIPMIWDSIATAPGLAAWFADDVSCNGKTYTFVWGKHESRVADLINCRQNTYVRFHWRDESPNTYFEIRIVKNEMTGYYTLEIIDFAAKDEREDIRNLWDTSIDALRRCGL